MLGIGGMLHPAQAGSLIYLPRVAARGFVKTRSLRWWSGTTSIWAAVDDREASFQATAALHLAKTDYFDGLMPSTSRALRGFFNCDQKRQTT